MISIIIDACRRIESETYCITLVYWPIGLAMRLSLLISLGCNRDKIKCWWWKTNLKRKSIKESGIWQKKKLLIGFSCRIAISWIDLRFYEVVASNYLSRSIQSIAHKIEQDRSIATVKKIPFFGDTLTRSPNVIRFWTQFDQFSLLFQYAIFLLVIIIVQVVIAVLLFAYGENIKEGLVKSVNSLFDKRSSPDVDKATQSVIDNLQQQVY